MAPLPVLGTDVTSALLAEADRRAPAMVELLLRLAEMESPSADPASQGPVLDVLEDELGRRGFATRRLPGRRSGGVLVAAPGSAPAAFQPVSYTHLTLPTS